jgi:hypothetical protein
VFDDAAKALEFDEESVKKIITNLNELKENHQANGGYVSFILMG